MNDKINILLIEDNEADVGLINFYLKDAYQHNYLLSVAVRLSAGLELLANNDFDIIIIDLTLPDSSGINTYKEVYAAAAEKPIIVLTGYEDESVGINTVKLGAQDFLIKGKIGSKSLHRSINYSIERSKLLKSLSENTRMLEEKTADLLREKQKLAEAQKLAHIGSWELNIKDGSFTCSDELYYIFGLDPKECEITYELFLHYIHPEDKSFVKFVIEESVKDLQSFDFFHRIICQQQQIKTLHARGELLLGKEGTILRIVGTEQDVTRRKKEEQHEQLAMVAIKSYNAVTIADQEGKIEWVNEGFTKLFGYKLEDVKGTYGEILQRAGTELSIEAGFYKSLRKKKKPLSYENKNYSKDGNVYWVLTSLTPILNDKGKVEKIISIDSDITKQKNAEQELIIANRIAEYSLSKGNRALDELHKAKLQLEESLKVKEQFLANMSHEIRTPMNAIIGFTNLLLKNEFSPENKQYLNAIRTSGENLLVIINDILDFSKLESGKINFEFIQFNFPNLISMLIDLMLPKAVEKKIHLFSALDPNIPDYLIGDPTRLNQILINLVGNAIKFTNQGEVKLSVDIANETEDEIEIKFAITDTGIGIAAENLPKIFESFTQATNSTTRKYGGTGLGLSITKQLVELQGGKIDVTSELEKGSCFSLNLKFEKNSQSEDAILSAYEEFELKFPLEGIKVLLVEDNVLNQMLATKILSNWKCDTDVAENGLIASEKINQHNYDIVLMDIQLPEMDGYEATHFIRNKTLAPTCNTPIIAMTAHAFADEAEKCIKSGMNDYISKPFDEKKLYAKICKVLSKNEKLISNFEKKIVDKTSLPTKQFIDLSYLEKIGNNDSGFVLKMISVFLSQTPDLLAKLGLSIAQQDWEALTINSHKIKPSISFIGLKELEDVIETIEDYSSRGVLLNELPFLFKKAEYICNAAIKELEIEKKKLEN